MISSASTKDNTNQFHYAGERRVGNGETGFQVLFQALNIYPTNFPHRFDQLQLLVFPSFRFHGLISLS